MDKGDHVGRCLETPLYLFIVSRQLVGEPTKSTGCHGRVEPGITLKGVEGGNGSLEPGITAARRPASVLSGRVGPVQSENLSSPPHYRLLTWSSSRFTVRAGSRAGQGYVYGSGERLLLNFPTGW